MITKSILLYQINKKPLIYPKGFVVVMFIYFTSSKKVKNVSSWIF